MTFSSAVNKQFAVFSSTGKTAGKSAGKSVGLISTIIELLSNGTATSFNTKFEALASISAKFKFILKRHSKKTIIKQFLIQVHFDIFEHPVPFLWSLIKKSLTILK